jgi:hypothetical protein
MGGPMSGMQRNWGQQPMQQNPGMGSPYARPGGMNQPQQRPNFQMGGFGMGLNQPQSSPYANAGQGGGPHWAQQAQQGGGGMPPWGRPVQGSGPPQGDSRAMYGQMQGTPPALMGMFGGRMR